MHEIDFEAISLECAKYKSNKLIKALPFLEQSNSLRRLIDYETKNFKNVQLHDVNRRKKRDSFFESIIGNVSCQKTKASVSRLLSVCQITEELIDDIKLKLKETPVMKKTVQEQCWAVINNALGEGYHLQNLLEENIQNYRSENKFISTSGMNIHREDGVSFSPDSALDKIVNYLALTLKMFAYEHKLSKKGEIIIPSVVRVDEDVVSNATSIFYLALIWNELITCSKSCILFDNKVYLAKSDEIPDKFKSDGIDTAVLFDRTIDKFERYNSISNERLSRRISQNFWEAVAGHNIGRELLEDITKWPGVIDNRSIILEEIPSLVSLMEAISSHNPNNIILGLSLREWVRGYSVVTYLSQKSKNKVNYTYGEIESVFLLAGFNKEKTKLFIDMITFGDNSRDIYDSPVIKVSDGSYFIFTPAYTAPLISNIILSKFSSMQADLSVKGFGFENDIIDLLNKHKLQNKKFEFKRGSEQFEYDAVFLLDNKAFILECKNTSLSGGSVTKAYNKKKFIYEACEQVKRLVNGLRLHPEVFREHFDCDVNDYDLIPVIMNNLPFSIPGEVNGVYVTDSSSFSRLLKSRYINSSIIKNEGGFKLTDVNPVISMWEGDSLRASDIINHFNNPVQLNDFLKHGDINTHILRVNESKAFFNRVIETNYDAISDEQAKVIQKSGLS
ncbi:hypothetical protein G5647_09270 [Pectobacterium carotovorum]|uniref:hypothetical protein n=1 Tax=Pectobacterium carotovorum TaxID=554 RepID=UPI00191FE7E4|nr:hypothetical protein [Pectobacterium carotovorum]MBL0866616.1 hypothetical protein [Pectobacterium carotovorum]